MPTIHVTPFPTETPWQEFEKMTLHGMSLKWGSPTLQVEGRSGQNQHGVDIYGPDYLGRPVAIQCKRYVAKLKFATVIEEVANAEQFENGSNLNCLYIATTVPRDAKLQRDVRVLSEDRIKKGKFAVGLIYWEDIFTGLLLDDKILASYFPYLKFPSLEVSDDTEGRRRSGLYLGYYGRYLWLYIELMFGEFGWLANQDPEEMRTILRLIRKNAIMCSIDIREEIQAWTNDIESLIFSDSTAKIGSRVKALAKRVEERVKNLPSLHCSLIEADFIKLGIAIGAIGWRDGKFEQIHASRITEQFANILPTATALLPEVITAQIGRESYCVAPVLFNFAERELRWPTSH